MSPFLYQTALDLYQRFGNDLSNVRVVFPNQRSILYFRKYLSEVVEKPIWSPECVTISNFIQRFSKLKKANDLILLFELYKVYSEVRKTDESFDVFYYWGELMLSDFDDIDKYLVDAQNLFQNLSALKNINELFSYLTKEQIDAIKQFWTDFGESRKSTHHNEFSQLWASMYSIYSTFKQRIRNKNIAYEGMIYRDVADSIKDHNFNDETYIQTAFVGFNALSECEKDIFFYFKQSEKALFYWDYNKDYIDNTVHEAGFFMRKNLKNFPSALSQTYFENKPKPGKIDLISIPSNVGQAKIVNELIRESSASNNEPEKTAILLTDEKMLLPVLHAIPDEIENINITMGFPVENSPAYTLIESVCRLHSQVKNEGFYYKNVLEILSHPYIQHYDKLAAKKISELIISSNLIYISNKQLLINEIFNCIFSPLNNVQSLLNTIEKLCSIIGNRFKADNHEAFEQPVGIESETLTCIFSTINHLADIIQQIDNEIDVSLGATIILKALKGLKIPFEGEPLKGIQVMGFLESRALDFENVIILGVNEGNLPKTNVPSSFIPYNLRHGFNLPTLEYRDAMYAYYFYRVIDRAKNIFLVYNSKADKMGSAEVSRYATQLVFDGSYNIVQKAQQFYIKPSDVQPIIVEKNGAVLEKLLLLPKRENKFLSPSALTHYIDCSLRFYYKYIECIKEPDTTTEEIDAPTLGNILHKTMQRIYSPYIKQVISEEIIDLYLTNNKLIEKEINKAIATEYIKNVTNPDEYVPEGRNFIIARIINKYIKQILKTDRKIAPFTLKALEQKVTHEIECIVNSIPTRLTIGGFIDRIDETTDGTRIVDYKTGVVNTKFLAFDELFNTDEIKKSKKEIFQALLYAIIYKQSTKKDIKIVPVLYNMRDLFDENFDGRIICNKNIVENINIVENDFTSKIVALLEEIFNPEKPFTQTSETGKCSYCPYNSICHR